MIAAVNCAVDDHAAIEPEHPLGLGKCGALDGWIWRIWPRGKFFETLTVTALARRRWQGHARLLVPLVSLLSGSRHLSCPLRFKRWMCGGSVAGLQPFKHDIGLCQAT